jgi:hypothetical protein
MEHKEKQVPTNCMDTDCPHNHTCGMPDFMNDDYCCTLHFECDLGYEDPKDCKLKREVK